MDVFMETKSFPKEELYEIIAMLVKPVKCVYFTDTHIMCFLFNRVNMQ